MILYLLLIQSVNAYINNWFPITTISSHDYNNPKQIRILGKDYVLWKKEDEYVFQDDSCPHRCAPLSEGYIDRHSKNIRCAYHGWEFDDKGNCTIIPQLSNNNKLLNSKSCLKSYPTFQHGDMLWGYLGNNTNLDFPIKNYNLDNSSAFVRELPISLYILLENFVDPAHIPYAHHKLQSIRDMGSPIEISLLSKVSDSQKFSIKFEEFSEYKPCKSRSGIINFKMPCYYNVEFIKPVTNILSKLHILFVPVEEDITRIFVKYEIKNKIVQDIFKLIPKWLIHLSINRFLDSDTLILHKQDNYINENSKSYHSNKNYYLPTESDKGIILFRKWIKKSLPNIPHFYKRNNKISLSRNDILNRYDQHTKNCIHCKKALKNTKLLKIYGTAFFILLHSFTRRFGFLFLGLMNYYGCLKIEKSFIFQDYVHNLID